MNNKSCKGFTLIEMAIVVMIIGLLVASLTPLYARYQENKRIQATQAHINTAISAIGSFRSLYGRYPCPASLTATRDNPAYGRENCDLSGIATNSAANGFYVERSVRTPIDFQYPVGTLNTGAQPRVIVGTIPFRQLNLDESGAYDGYGSRLTYAITEHLTCANCFQPNQGGIDIVNDSGDTVLPQRGTAHFMVFSYGQNTQGAFNVNGSQSNCAGSGAENENCDFTTGNYDATFQIASANTSGSAANYDDVVNYFTQDETPLWQMSTNPNAAARRAIHQKADGDVAIMTPPGDIDQPGDVGGTVRATAETPVDPAAPTGRVIASEICTSTGANCFSPLVIAGTINADPALDTGGLKCPEDDPDGAGKFMVAIKNGRPVCSDTVKDTCDDGEFATGINASGEIECSEVSGCPTGTAQLCSQTLPLASGAEGTRQTIRWGNSATQVYVCNNGQWLAEGSMSGSCGCTPANTTGPVACPAGYSGTRTRHFTRVCPSGATTTTYTNVDCDCVDNYPQNRTRSCPSGYSGSIPQVRTFRCASGTWSAWTDVDGANAVTENCTCTNRTETRYVACGPNQTGSIEEERTISCTPGGVVTGDWEPVSGGGTCQPKVCKWKTSSSPQGPYAFTTGTNLGSSCSCGASGKCYSVASAGLYNHYQVCRCE